MERAWGTCCPPTSKSCLTTRTTGCRYRLSTESLLFGKRTTADGFGCVRHVRPLTCVGGCVCAQIDKETVRLRRSIGLKKDEYFLDRKHITYVLAYLNTQVVPHLQSAYDVLTVLSLGHFVQETGGDEPARKCWFFTFKSILCGTAGKGTPYVTCRYVGKTLNR
jgi:hypothetical protein